LLSSQQLIEEEDEEEEEDAPSSPDVGVRVVRVRRIVDSSVDDAGESDFTTTQAVPWWKKQKEAKVMLPRPPIKSVYVEAEAEEEDDEFKGLGGHDREGENDDVLDMSLINTRRLPAFDLSASRMSTKVLYAGPG
jgi:hypothetical protein